MTVLAQRQVALRVYPPAVGLLGQVAVLVWLGTKVGLGAAGWLTGVAFAVATWALLSRALRQPGVHRWGPADSVTYGRLVLTGGVATLVVESIFGVTHHVVLIALAAASLALDGVDGQIARRTRTTSSFGASFDMEADSVLAVVLSVYVASTIGWWAGAIGFFRYAFAAASWVFPWLRGALPARLSRKAVAAFQGVVLVVASAGLLPGPLLQACVAVSLVSLVWSFGIDVRYLRRQDLRRQDLRRQDLHRQDLHRQDLRRPADVRVGADGLPSA